MLAIVIVPFTNKLKGNNLKTLFFEKKKIKLWTKSSKKSAEKAKTIPKKKLPERNISLTNEKNYLKLLHKKFICPGIK